MSTVEPLTSSDYPLRAVGQYVYRNGKSSPMIGPVSIQLATDLAARLNREGQRPRLIVTSNYKRQSDNGIGWGNG